MKFSQFTKITGGYRYKLMSDVYQDWIKKGDNILDIGCGTGIMTKLLIDNFSVNITGCDIKNYLIFKIPFFKLKDGKIPVKENSYDLAMLNDVLHHVNKDQQVILLKEAIRIAKKVLVFEAEPTILGKITDIILNKYHYGDLHTPLSFRNTKAWLDIFKQLSFSAKVVKIKGHFWYPFSHIAFLITKK